MTSTERSNVQTKPNRHIIADDFRISELVITLAPGLRPERRFAPLARGLLYATGADWAVGHSGANRGPENFGGPEFTRFRITTNYLSKHSPDGLHMRNHISKSVKLQKVSHVKQILPKFASIHCNCDCHVCPLTHIVLL